MNQKGSISAIYYFELDDVGITIVAFSGDSVNQFTTLTVVAIKID